MRQTEKATAPAMSKTAAIYHAVTRGISVSVTPAFLAERSAPAQGQFFWAYTIDITNETDGTVQLLTRHWTITDAFGNVQDVRGEGVIGQQPEIGPGSSFTYTSGCPLTTPEGSMEGSYGMVDARGQRFDVIIPLFALDSPLVRRTLH
jgi:ApaG protein